MKTSQEIRLANLHLLVAEAGSKAKLSQKTGVPAPFITQLVNGTPLSSGNARKLGDDTARKLEVGMLKREGWMDADHSRSIVFGELNALEAQLITLFRALPEEDRDEILGHTNNVFSKRFPSSGPGNPFANAPAPGAKPVPRPQPAGHHRKH